MTNQKKSRRQIPVPPGFPEYHENSRETVLEDVWIVHPLPTRDVITYNIAVAPGYIGRYILMINETQHHQVNEAIVRFIGSGWSEEAARAITEAYGTEITRAVRYVYDVAIDCPVDWRTATMDSALDTLWAFLPTQFPWLTQEAKTRLNYCYIMTWK